MATSPQCPSLPNEVWLDILSHLSLEALWHSTRPVCSLFYDISASIAKEALVQGSKCELRHYISHKDPLLAESLQYISEPSVVQQRILTQEGHSSLSQILLWSSTVSSPANPQHGPGIPTITYESADGKKCVTMAVFGQDSSSTSGFHCRRTGCVLDGEHASDGHVCLAGCWHVHYSRVDKKFTATIPLGNLLPIYLRLESAKRSRNMETSFALQMKGRWSVAGRHGVSASVSPVTLIDDDVAMDDDDNASLFGLFD
jgi:hypothetical protein